MGTGYSIAEQANEQNKPPALSDEWEYIATTSRMQDTVGIWDILSILWQRKGLILAIVTSVTAAALIVLFQVQPTFRAQSLVLIESSSPDITSLANVAVGMPADPESIQSEMVVLRAPSLAKEVIERLGLARDPEFNAALRPPGWLEGTISQYLRPVVAWLGAALGRNNRNAERQAHDNTDNAAAAKKQRVGAQRSDMIRIFLDKLEVSVQGNSRVIAVGFSSHDAQTAAQVPNILAEVYLQRQRAAKQKIAELDTQLLGKRVAALRQKVESADQAVEAYRKESGLLQGDKGSPLIMQQLTDTSTQLTLAQAARSKAQARLDQIEALARTPGGIESSNDVMDSALIPYLREQKIELQRKKGELTAKLTDQHPAVLRLQADIREMNARIKAEEKRVVEGYRSDVAATKAQKNSVQNEFDQFKTAVAEANEKEIKLRSLQREADADRTLLATMLSRLKETRQQQDVGTQQADARIVSLADVPINPAFPKKGAMVTLALVGSSLLSVLIVLVSEQRDRGFRSNKQIEQALGMPVFGAVPKLGASNSFLKVSNAYKIFDESNPALKEAMRSIYGSIVLSHRDRSPRKILITSSVPNEGKTAIAVNLARMEALAGKNVVVVDADLRSPDIHHAFASPKAPGLVELVTGDVGIDTVLRKDSTSGAWFITAGTAASDPLAILTSQWLDEILDRLTERFDLVIFDSPPSNMFVDARILSTKIEKTLFVVRWGGTPQEIVRDVFKRHAQSGAHVSGVIFSMTSRRTYSQYG